MEVLQRHFAGSEANIELEPTTGLYNGHLLWEQFENLSFVERQKSVFDVLRAEFGAEAQQIGMIFTYTPAQYAELLAA
jgi:acid stress-induced BolA-like protein IbaG/YrbA